MTEISLIVTLNKQFNSIQLILRTRLYLLHRRVPLGQSMNFIYVVNGFYYAVIKSYT